MIKRPEDVAPEVWSKFKNFLYRRRQRILKLIPSARYYGVVIQKGKVPFYDIPRKV
jgi:hypothetical protein